MLRDLGAAGGVPVPGVVHAEAGLLVMEHVESDGRLDAGAERDAAEVVARLHGRTSEDGRFGYAYDTLIGGLDQANGWMSTWAGFFAERRLVSMARRAHSAGRIDGVMLGRVEALAGRVERWIGEPERPALLHGDLWGGNVLVRGGRVAALIDPAIYFGHPEIELAFGTLFGTFGDAFFERYRELRGLEDGFFEERRDLYNLYPLLVHARLFGGGYVGSVDATLGRFGF